MKALIALVTTSLALSACSSPTAPKLEEASAVKAKAALVGASKTPATPGRLAAN